MKQIVLLLEGTCPVQHYPNNVQGFEQALDDARFAWEETHVMHFIGLEEGEEK